MFRHSGLFWVQGCSYKHENWLCNGKCWSTSTATPLEHPTGVHVQGSRAASSHTQSRASSSTLPSAGELLPVEVVKG